MKETELFANSLVSTSIDDICCNQHKSLFKFQETCDECNQLKEKILKYMTHSHTFTCHKKKKVITVSENEGHGRLDGQERGIKLSNIPVCRFNFPKMPMDKTTLVVGLSKDCDESTIKKYKADLKKIMKYLVCHTIEESKWEDLKQFTFDDFLFHVGMFDHHLKHQNVKDEDRKSARM